MKPRPKHLPQFRRYDCDEDERIATELHAVQQNAAQLILRRLAHEMSERIRLPL